MCTAISINRAKIYNFTLSHWTLSSSTAINLLLDEYAYASFINEAAAANTQVTSLVAAQVRWNGDFAAGMYDILLDTGDATRKFTISSNE